MNTANIETLRRDQVLALDIAQTTGYCSTHESGEWDFHESLRRNNNKQHLAFRDTLMDFIVAHGIRQIVAEDVSAGSAKGGFKASVKLSEFRGILLEICDRLNIPEPAFVNLRTIKKWATGDGNADKKKMIEFCRRRWGKEPISDNEADATHIFMYYVRKYDIK